MKKLVLKILFFVILQTPIFATTYYVDAVNGNNSYNGLTIATAKKTLSWFSYSTTFLQPGDTILLLNGTYTGGTSFAILALRASGTPTNPITIKNYSGHSPLLQMNDSQWHAIHLGESIHDIIIDGLKIRGNAANINLSDALNQPGSCANTTGSPIPKFNGNGITIDGRTNDALVHHITIRNCEIFECSGGGLISLRADYLNYENNFIYNNSWYTIYGSSGISNLNSMNYDSHSSGGYTMIIKNNVVYGNELYVPWIGPCLIYDGNGIIVDSENNVTIGKPAYTGKTLIENNIVHHNGGRGIHMLNSNNVDVINNTCYMNGRSPAISDGEITVQGATNVRIFNNIMYARDGERANYKDAPSTGFSSGNNLIFNAASNKISFTNTTDKVNQDPLFVNTDLNTGNFNVQNTSPAINAGNTIIFAPKDYEGVIRPQGPTSDIGAYEFVGSLSNTAFNETFNNLLIYPNPSSSDAKLRYSVKQKENIKITLYDCLGKELLQLINEEQYEGEYELAIKTSQLQNGIYYIRLNNGYSDEKSIKFIVKSR